MLPTPENNVYSTSENNSGIYNQIYQNTKTNLISVNEDKLELILTKHEKHIGVRSAWITPLSLFVSILLTLLTATFNKTFLGVDASTWNAGFLLITVTSIIWFIVSLVRLIKYWKQGTIENLLNEIKNHRPENS